MVIEVQTNSSLKVRLPNGKSFTVMYYAKQDEISICFHEGRRHISEHQNRPDGYSGTTFTKAED